MKSENSWELQLSNDIAKALKRFPKADSRRLLETIGYLPDEPYAGDIKKIRGNRETWRRRVGEYRILFEIWKDEKVIFVYSVERRNSKTY